MKKIYILETFIFEKSDILDGITARTIEGAYSSYDGANLAGGDLLEEGIVDNYFVLPIDLNE